MTVARSENGSVTGGAKVRTGGETELQYDPRQLPAVDVEPTLYVWGVIPPPFPNLMPIGVPLAAIPQLGALI